MTKAKLIAIYNFNKIIKKLVMSFIFIVLILEISSKHKVVNAEYFSSVDKLKSLINVDVGLIDIFLDYLEMQNSEFDKFRQFINNVKFQHTVALKDKQDYLENPINAFKLVKRLAVDWAQLNNFVNQSKTRMEASFLKKLEDFKKGNEVPEYSELLGAVKGLVRLQKVYELKTDDLSKGVINGVSYSTKLNWHDCFEIGVNLYNQKQFDFALNWFEKSLQKLNSFKQAKNETIQQKFKIECLEYLALSNFRLGQTDKVTHYIKKLQDLLPNHSMKSIHSYLLNSESEKSLPVKSQHEKDALYKNYTLLCQGKQFPEKKFSKLKCKLETLNKPYFILAPLKVEVLNFDPDIKIYHGVLNDEQIKRIILEAENKMDRSKLVGGKTSDIRVSQQAWLTYESPIMRTVYNLVSNITGLNLSNAEEMQMANYGIGGQYDFHRDFFGPDFKHDRFKGDRIITNMFYLSDVEHGGYTVFPKLNIYLRPIKGALIVWYNLHKSLDPDYRTVHAGCPVIKGSKRIGNVWVHSTFQEFQRPCGLKNDNKEKT